MERFSESFIRHITRFCEKKIGGAVNEDEIEKIITSIPKWEKLSDAQIFAEISRNEGVGKSHSSGKPEGENRGGARSTTHKRSRPRW